MLQILLWCLATLSVATSSSNPPFHLREPDSKPRTQERVLHTIEDLLRDFEGAEKIQNAWPNFEVTAPSRDSEPSLKSEDLLSILGPDELFVTSGSATVTETVDAGGYHGKDVFPLEKESLSPSSDFPFAKPSNWLLHKHSTDTKTNGGKLQVNYNKIYI